MGDHNAGDFLRQRQVVKSKKSNGRSFRNYSIKEGSGVHLCGYEDGGDVRQTRRSRINVERTRGMKGAKVGKEDGTPTPGSLKKKKTTNQKTKKNPPKRNH